ncbi:MAG: FtsX-like permease family protein [Patescibacteria group bacterium]|jgi:ABC-type lipoprotein release transport system permease subunit
MFYIRYLWAELTRRSGKTLMISLGLGMASAVIIVIISISQSLSTAQDTVLNPLQNVGTDIMVSRSLDPETIQTLDDSAREEMLQDNRITTDLAKLGNPGEAFSTDNFLPGTLLTFDQGEMDKLDSSLVANSAAGLVMNVAHQEGTIPQVTAEFETGGETFQVNTDIAAMTSAEQAAVDAARNAAMTKIQSQGLDPQSAAARKIMEEAMNAAMPERFKRQTTEFVAPKRIFRQEVGPITTDISTEGYTVAGVDTTKTDIGLILPGEITSGTYFTGADQAVVNTSYADKNNIAVGDKLTLAGKELTVVGLVQPKLYSQTADVYLPLKDLQTLSGRENRINVMLIKSTSADAVDETSTALESVFAGAEVTDAQDTAKEVTGSLVNAANLTNKFIGITSVIVIAAAFVIVSLLTILSVNKRVREIGTLKAIGWSNTKIVRQIISENVVLGILGALIGIGLAVGAILILNRADITLSATVANSTDGGFGFARRIFSGSEAASEQSGVATSVTLNIAYSYLVLLMGSAVALLGAMVSGTFAALKASKMKPQEALRNLE